MRGNCHRSTRYEIGDHLHFDLYVGRAETCDYEAGMWLAMIAKEGQTRFGHSFAVVAVDHDGVDLDHMLRFRSEMSQHAADVPVHLYDLCTRVADADPFVVLFAGHLPGDKDEIAAARAVFAGLGAGGVWQAGL
jgi:hypothetical protein